tara:strand:- start:13559 stop:13942 length:384 start_codon:yes stop_codon:yes gene_type:complete
MFVRAVASAKLLGCEREQQHFASAQISRVLSISAIPAPANYVCRHLLPSFVMVLMPLICSAPALENKKTSIRCAGGVQAMNPAEGERIDGYQHYARNRRAGGVEIDGVALRWETFDGAVGGCRLAEG